MTIITHKNSARFAPQREISTSYTGDKAIRYTDRISIYSKNQAFYGNLLSFLKHVYQLAERMTTLFVELDTTQYRGSVGSFVSTSGH